MSDTWKGLLKDLFTLAFLIIVVVIPIRIFVASPFVVDGDSMYPTFENFDYLIHPYVEFDTALSHSKFPVLDFPVLSGNSSWLFPYRSFSSLSVNDKVCCGGFNYASNSPGYSIFIGNRRYVPNNSFSVPLSSSNNLYDFVTAADISSFDLVIKTPVVFANEGILSVAFQISLLQSFDGADSNICKNSSIP